MIQLAKLITFIHVTESNSFSVAAKKLRVSVPAVSTQISNLENELGVKLLERTTRKLSLTEFGQVYYEQCKRLIHVVKETENIGQSFQAEPRGILKVFANRYFGEKWIIPYLNEFMDLYPKIELDLELGERMPNPHDEHIDIIFGVSMRGPESWIQKKIAETRYVFCASPEYFKRYKNPLKPLDLLKHKYITHRMRKPENVIEFDNNLKITLVPALKLNDTHSMLQCALKV